MYMKILASIESTTVQKLSKEQNQDYIFMCSLETHLLLMDDDVLHSNRVNISSYSISISRLTDVFFILLYNNNKKRVSMQELWFCATQDNFFFMVVSGDLNV